MRYTIHAAPGIYLHGGRRQRLTPGKTLLWLHIAAIVLIIGGQASLGWLIAGILCATVAALTDINLWITWRTRRQTNQRR